jgi:hypothetical protein
LNGVLDPVLEPRRTSRLSGRLDWLLPDGEYQVGVETLTHRPALVERVALAEGGRAYVIVALEPLAELEWSCRAISDDGEEPLNAELTLTDGFGGRRQVRLGADAQRLSLAPGIYRAQVTAPERLPLVEAVDVREDGERIFRLQGATVAFAQDFSSDAGWQRGGVEQRWGIETIEGRIVLSDSPGGAYMPGSDSWLVIATGVALDSLHSTVLECVHRVYFEPGRDFALIEAYRDPGEWASLGSFTGFPAGWDTFYVNLDHLPAGELTLRLRCRSDNIVDEDGWLVDQITIYQAEGGRSVPVAQAVGEELSLRIYPNPSNGSLLAILTLPKAATGGLALYDLSGRPCGPFFRGSFTAGEHRFWLPGKDRPSGAYFLRFESREWQRTARLFLVK